MKQGLHVRKSGIEFTVHSTANRVDLLLFDRPEQETPSRVIEMKRIRPQLWHTAAPEATVGMFYLYRTDAIPEQWLLDPFARAVHVPRAWGDSTGLIPGRHIRTGRHFPKCVIIDEAFDWRGEKRPHTPPEKTIIYEAHLRGFTRGKGGGSYLDFIEKIPYLQSLGITAVEFLPLFEFNELEFFIEGHNRRHLLNFWGYSTCAFFAPMSRFASSSEPGAAVREFKTLVKALHQAGIEVILDVVFNHTAEGLFDGQTYSFRGLDEAAYYLINHDGSYPNWSGCGNSVNANHPVTRELIVECLKYWVQEMHVDGFRFDLATALCRGSHGHLLKKPPLIKAIEAEPALKKTKLIAEAWDAGGGYQVGSFPGERFADWNGKFRDEVRLFWNGDLPAGPLATRLAGSSDLYEHRNGSPLKSINFITSHDGYTLEDLVSYERKHNQANGEHNRDGENHSFSINFGHEGPSKDPALRARRRKQQKNLLTTLFLSQGIPMLTAGDEFGRTQQGNNNAYCQDNKISWVNWSLLETNRDLFEFTRKLIDLRKKHPGLHRKNFLTGKRDVRWIGPGGKEVDWNHGRALGMYLCGRDKLLVLINNEPQAAVFSLPKHNWKLELTTGPVSETPEKGRPFSIPPHSIAVLL